MKLEQILFSTNTQKLLETCQKLAFTRPIVVCKRGLKNNWTQKLDRVNRPLNQALRYITIILAWPPGVIFFSKGKMHFSMELDVYNTLARDGGTCFQSLRSSSSSSVFISELKHIYYRIMIVIMQEPAASFELPFQHLA